MDYSYSYDVKENMAKAVAKNLSISHKHAIEVCRFLRNEPVERAKVMLFNVINKKQAVPFKRFYHNVGFKTKIGPGRYPVKTATEILKLLNHASNNAQLKGLATGKLEVCHICAKKGSKIFKRGRQIRRKMKQCTVEVVVREIPKVKEEAKPGKAAKKEPKKVEKQEKKIAKPVQKEVVKETKEIKKESKTSAEIPAKQPKHTKQVKETKPAPKVEPEKSKQEEVKK
ncbi:50S ribosomal protein L22 [Candidatus Woesearchaeota archaeon]|nr:50S ribosomal protein L22 [Candidatus Woesearchaeota archaeon]